MFPRHAYMCSRKMRVIDSKGTNTYMHIYKRIKSIKKTLKKT